MANGNAPQNRTLVRELPRGNAPQNRTLVHEEMPSLRRPHPSQPAMQTSSTAPRSCWQKCLGRTFVLAVCPRCRFGIGDVVVRLVFDGLARRTAGRLLSFQGCHLLRCLLEAGQALQVGPQNLQQVLPTDRNRSFSQANT
jgi:hypothetical protein